LNFGRRFGTAQVRNPKAWGLLRRQTRRKDQDGA
jgi:hypothetical protein